LAKKGRGFESKLAYMGHALMENRHGLLVDFQLTYATGTAEQVTLNISRGPRPAPDDDPYPPPREVPPSRCALSAARQSAHRLGSLKPRAAWKSCSPLVNVNAWPQSRQVSVASADMADASLREDQRLGSWPVRANNTRALAISQNVLRDPKAGYAAGQRERYGTPQLTAEGFAFVAPATSASQRRCVKSAIVASVSSRTGKRRLCRRHD
jgi:hypothetical protein